MKIAINCAFYQPRGGGISEYIYNLVTNLVEIDRVNDYLIYVLEDYIEYASKTFTGVRIKSMPYTSQQTVRRSIFEQFFWLQEERTEKFDIFHSPFFHSPILKKAKQIMTVHDLRFCVYPSTYAFIRLHFLRYAVRKSVKTVDHIISISEFTKSELMKYYNLSNDRITTIHEAINREDFSTEKIDYSKLDTSMIEKLIKKKFLFTLGHIEPRKNYVSLVRAFKKLRENGNEDVYLVVAGKRAHGYREFIKEIEDDLRIIYLDFVSRDMLLWLYSNATAFVFPSIYEGFGFPPLEAASLGTVSAVANSSCIPEICGDGATYFDPYDINDMANVCDRILNDEKLRNHLLVKAKDNLERYSWRRNAEETLALYNSLLSER